MNDATTGLEAADIVQILSYLPHRYPFLLIDRIIEMKGDESCIGIKNVTYNEPQFMGHFPSRPLFPGVFMIEGMAQTAGAMCVASKLAQKARPKELYVMTIYKANFGKRVVPADTVEYHRTKIANLRNFLWYLF